MTRLYPTDQAEAALPEIRRVLGEWEAWITQDLTEEERDGLKRILEKLKNRAAVRTGQG